MPRRKLAAITAGGRYEDYSTPIDREGADARIADMCRARRAPGLKGTDAINFAGVANSDPFPHLHSSLKAEFAAEAKRQGVSLSGKRYMTSLVRPEFAGRFDPQALVDSTGDVKRTLESRGWGTVEDSESMVNVKPREIEEDHPLDQPYSVDPKLVEERLNMELEAEGVERIGKREYTDLLEKKQSELTGDMNDV